MASEKKIQKECDQAIRHLMEYMEKEPWSTYFSELSDEFFQPIAKRLDREVDDVLDALLFSEDYGGIARGYLFEEMACCQWNNDEGSMTDAYLKERGWREKPFGKAYLRALSNSSVKLWEAQEVEPGEWIELKQYGTDKKAQRVRERSASQSVQIGDIIAARVIRVGKHDNITGAPLPITADQALKIQQQLAGVPDQVTGFYQTLVESGEIKASEIPADLTSEIEHTCDELSVSLPYSFWALSVLKSQTQPLRPHIRNTDDEAIVLTKHPIQNNR